MKANRFTEAIDLYTAVKLCDHRRTAEMDKQIILAMKASEQMRIKAMDAFEKADKLKLDAEKARDDAEKARQLAEEALKEAEKQTLIANQARDSARMQAELAKKAMLEAQKARDEAEHQRQLAERQRRAAENHARFLFYEKENPTLAHSIAWYNALTYRDDHQSYKGLYSKILADTSTAFFCTLFDRAFFYSRLSILHNGQLILASDSYDVQAWDLSSGKKKFRIKSSCPIQGFRTSFDSRLLLLHCQGNLQLWNLETRRLIDTIRCPLNLSSASFAPDNQSLLLSYRNGMIELYNLKTHKVSKSWIWAKNDIQSAFFSPQGKYIVMGGQERYAVWNLKDTQPKWVRVHKNSNYNDYPIPIFSSTGKYWMSVHENKKFKVWDVETCQMWMGFSKHQRPILSGIFSSNDSLLMTADESNIYIWNMTNKTMITTFGVPPTHQIKKLVFIEQRPYFFSRTANGELRLWQLDDIDPLGQQKLGQHKGQRKKCIYQYSFSELRAAGVLLEPEDELQADKEESEKKIQEEK